LLQVLGAQAGIDGEVRHLLVLRGTHGQLDS
jgi:hypothetical protein